MLKNQLSEIEYKKIIEDLQKARYDLIAADSSPSNRVAHNLLKNILKQIFKDSKNFIFELIQNADDQKALEIRIILDKDSVIFAHNSEHPFTKTDLEDISNIAKSEKISASYKIGQKGIGFKNVFKITNYPKIFCGNLRFTFKHEDEYYKVIYPDWLNEYKKDDEFTYFILNLDLEKVNYGLVREALNSINPRTLLFLNSVEKIIIEDLCEKTKNEFSRTPLKVGSNNNFKHKKYKIEKIDCYNNETIERTYYQVFSKEVEKKEVIDEGWERENNPRISIALEVDENDKLIFSDKITCDLYVYLPTKLKLGFKFILHGDFDTEVDRKDITDPSSNRFNKVMLEAVVTIFEDIINFYKSDEPNNIKFLELFPQGRDSNHPIFKMIQESLYKFISQKNIFLTERGKDIFQVANLVHRNIRGVPLESSDFFKYYSSNTDTEDILSLKVNSERALSLFNDLDGLKPDIDLILDILESTAKSKQYAWFLEFYSFLYKYTQRVSYPEKNETIKKILYKKIVLTEGGSLVDCDKTVFYYGNNVEYLKIPEVIPNFLDKKLLDNATEEIKEFVKDILEIKSFGYNIYFNDYLSPWIIEENIKNNEKEYYEILNFIFKFRNDIDFNGHTLYFLDRNEKVLPQNELFLGNDYKNKYYTESIFEMCGVEVCYLGKKYFSVINSDLKEIRDFFSAMGVNSIIPVHSDGNSEMKGNTLPPQAEYIIPKEEYHLWEDRIIKLQRIHGSIYRCDNYKSAKIDMILKKINSLNEKDQKDKELKDKLTKFLVGMLDENWVNYYSKRIFCDVWYNQNQTRGTKWSSYYPPKGHENSKLSDFGKLIKFKMKLPNELGNYDVPQALHLDNPLKPEKRLGIKLSSKEFIGFLNIQGSSSISDIIEHLKSLRTGSDILQNPKETYLDIFEKIKILVPEEKANYVNDLQNLIFLPDVKRWTSNADDLLYFEDGSGINEPHFLSISNQLKLKGKDKELLKKLFVDTLKVKNNPPIEEYHKLFGMFTTYQQLNQNDLKLIKKLVEYTTKEDINSLIGMPSIPNNKKYLTNPKSLYFPDIPVYDVSLDELLPHKDFQDLLYKHQEQLGIKDLSPHLIIERYTLSDIDGTFDKYFGMINRAIFYIKEIISNLTSPHK